MYPGMGFWNHAHRHHDHHNEERGCGPRGRHEGRDGGHHAFAQEDGDFGGFGVRRPLRFLAFKLELSEDQVEKLAGVLNDLKTERAQAAVDNRRTLAAFADAIGAEAFDDSKVNAAGSDRVKSAERLRDAVTDTLKRIHALLEPAQRTKLAYLIRTGALTL
jgi:Spy/CpxP family protein refolding chaperone